MSAKRIHVDFSHLYGILLFNMDKEAIRTCVDYDKIEQQHFSG